MYCGHGSASWTIPQGAGLYTIAKQMDPNISLEEFSEVCKETSIENNNGYRIINPEGMVREINQRNKEKSIFDDRYIKTSKNSSELISKLDKVIESKYKVSEDKDTFLDRLKSNIETNVDYNTIDKAAKDKTKFEMEME